MNMPQVSKKSEPSTNRTDCNNKYIYCNHFCCLSPSLSLPQVVNTEISITPISAAPWFFHSPHHPAILICRPHWWAPVDCLGCVCHCGRRCYPDGGVTQSMSVGTNVWNSHPPIFLDFTASKTGICITTTQFFAYFPRLLPTRSSKNCPKH